MNERIRELAEQATETVDVSEKLGMPGTDLVFNKEKFAELIVRECVVRIQGCHLIEDARSGEFELGYAKAINKASSQVLFHFGVEE